MLYKLLMSSMCRLPGDFKVSDLQQLMECLVVAKRESVVVSQGWQKLLALACRCLQLSQLSE